MVDESKALVPAEESAQILLYQTKEGETAIQVTLRDETVWLTQAQMTELFQTDRSSITKHIGNVYESGELERKSTCAKFAQVRQEGSRAVSRKIEFYNLDVIISVGYRVNSRRGTQFRIWATKRLREYILQPALTRLKGEMTPAEQALATIEALYMMARQQVELERQVAHAHARMDKASQVVGHTIERVGALELRVYGHYQVISEEQAAELAELVKTIAHTLTERDPAGGNYYQSVWGELHRRCGVTTYRRVPAAKFGEVVTWLESWLESLRGKGDG